MIVVGLDLSSTSSGVCVNGTCNTIAPKGDMLDRCRHMADTLRPTLLAADLVVVEDIATRHVQTAIAIASVHALVFDRVAGLIGPRIVKVSPNTLKKFATGNGHADKDAVLIAAIREGADVANNDESDAWWLWALGQHIDGHPAVPDTDYRTNIVRKANT